MAIDNESPPGSWKDELKAAPWGYGQSQNRTVESALVAIRKAGFWEESVLLAQEIMLLNAEIARLTKELQKGESK